MNWFTYSHQNTANSSSCLCMRICQIGRNGRGGCGSMRMLRGDSGGFQREIIYTKGISQCIVELLLKLPLEPSLSTSITLATFRRAHIIQINGNQPIISKKLHYSVY